MSNEANRGADPAFLRNSMASFIQIAALVLLLIFCFRIVSPFLTLVLWALLIAVAVFPMHLKLSAALGGRQKWSATLLVLVGLAVLLVPTWMTADSSIEAARVLAGELEDGSLTISPPASSVADWPVIGTQVHKVWTDAAANLEATLNQFRPELKAAARWLAGTLGSTAVGILQFVFSIIIAGVFMVSAQSGYRVSRAFATTLVGEENGAGLTDLAVATIRSVAKGVLGVAIIQALLSLIGLVVMDVPAAGIWAGIILVLAIVQLPPILIMAPIAIWIFSVAEPVPATIFAVYAAIVSGSDAFLKPLFLGRGMDIPMLVILVGAIGGAMLAGIIGLFLGAVVLALGYQLLMAWMVMEAAEDQASPGDSEPAA